MRRWHRDEAVMRRRLNLEKAIHAGRHERYEDCHCYERRGWYRKSRPLANDSLRAWRKIAQWVAHNQNKRVRRQPIHIEREHRDDG